MSILNKTTFIAALFSVVIFGLSACGGEEATSDADKAEEMRGVVKDVASQAKETASEVTAKAKETASEVTAKAKETASNVATKAKDTASDAVERIEDKIKVPSLGNESDSE